MFCTKCGTQNSEDSNHCYNCGAALNQAPNSSSNENTNYSQNTYSNNPYNQQSYGNEPYNEHNYNQSSKVENHMVWSILVTIFCCLPLGIPAIVFSAQVDDKLRSGNYTGAVESANQAKTFCWIAFGLGIAFDVFWILKAVLTVSNY